MIPGSGGFIGEGIDYPLQYSGLENSMDYTVHGVAKNGTQLSDFHFTIYNEVTSMGQFFLSLLSLSILSQINPIDHREVTKICFLRGDLRATI